MTVWLALGIAAAIAVVLIHYIHRGARQQLIVANPQLYADVARPRLVLHRLTHKWLLLVRLALLSLAFWVAFGAVQQAPDAQRTLAALAVVPGTPVAAWEAMLSSGQSAVWLDRDLTPVTEPAVSAFDARALRVLDTALPAGAPLTVIGALPARHWPRRGFAMTRPVRWVATDSVPASDDAPLIRPPNLVIAVEDADARAVLMAVTAIWRDAGIISDLRWTTLEEASFSSADAWTLWLGELQDLPPVPAHAVVVAITPEALVAVSERLTLTEHATALWQRVGHLPSDVPVSNAPVAGSPFVEVAGLTQRSELRPPGIVGSWWLLGFAGLFCIERILAQRRRLQEE